jgi:hypothetical protein
MNWIDSDNANLDAAGRWTPGLGDPTVMGWVTVAVYLLAAWLSWRVARQVEASGGSPRLWTVLALLLLALGLNKQLDLQSLFTQVGRDLAMAQGWYAQRRLVQAVFIGGLAVAALALGWWLRASLRDPHQRLAALGFSLLLAFVVMRAASFHHMDQLVNATLAGVRMNWVLELSGLLIIIVAARRALRGRRAGAEPGAGWAARFRAASLAAGTGGAPPLHPDVSSDVSPDDPALIAWLRVRLAPLRAVIARHQRARQRPARGQGASSPFAAYAAKPAGAAAPQPASRTAAPAPATATASAPEAPARRPPRGEVTRVPRRP